MINPRICCRNLVLVFGVQSRTFWKRQPGVKSLFPKIFRQTLQIDLLTCSKSHQIVHRLQLVESNLFKSWYETEQHHIEAQKTKDGRHPDTHTHTRTHTHTFSLYYSRNSGDTYPNPWTNHIATGWGGGVTAKIFLWWSFAITKTWQQLINPPTLLGRCSLPSVKSEERANVKIGTWCRKCLKDLSCSLCSSVYIPNVFETWAGEYEYGTNSECLHDWDTLRCLTSLSFCTGNEQ